MTAPTWLDRVNDYLAWRRGLGFELKSPEWMLRDFARHAERAGPLEHLTVEFATQWALASRSSDPDQATRRLTIVRPFARYLAVFDPATAVPPAALLGRAPRRKQPHIYNDTEIAALLRHAKLLLPRGGLRPRTYVTFFSLLASTGLRLSEACRLTSRDVDLADALITVRQSKFRKSRLVPIHPTTTQALARYVADRNAYRNAPLSDYFFRTERSPSLAPAAVKKTFSRLRSRLGWTDQGRARRPRIQDLRHAFAVRRLVRWYEEGADVSQKMLALSTYLGHAKVTDTYWYLSAVPELMTIAAQRFEQFVHQEQGDAP